MAWGNNNLRNAQFPGHIDGYEPATAAKGQQREVLGIVPKFNRDRSNGAGDLRSRDVENAQSEIGNAVARLLCNSVQRFFGVLRVECQSAAEGCISPQIANCKRGVGKGGFGPAAAVSCGARISACALGAYLQRTGFIEIGERSTTGTDRVNICLLYTSDAADDTR